MDTSSDVASSGQKRGTSDVKYEFEVLCSADPVTIGVETLGPVFSSNLWLSGDFAGQSIEAGDG